MREHYYCPVCTKKGAYLRKAYDQRGYSIGHEWYCRYCHQVLAEPPREEDQA